MGFKSSRALAEHIGIAPITLAKIEAGSSMPEETTLAAIATGLKCEESELLYAPQKKKKFTSPLSMDDAYEILKKLESTNARRRAFVLALLFEDRSILEAHADLQRTLDHLSKSS